MSAVDRRTLLIGAAAGAALPLVDGGAAVAAPAVSRVLARGLQVPWGLAFLPSGDALVGERTTGKVFRVDRAGGKRLVGQLAISPTGEGGLLGIAVAPTFADDRWVYFYLTRNGENRILRKRLRGGELGRAHPILDQIPSAPNHDGGRLAFGPDGLLYASTGDAGDPDSAQDLASYAGKILRLRPGGGVPDGNPFDTRVWTYGHRNVQGLAWDGRGRMWASELGQDALDELNRIRPGRNYGWPDAEGPSDQAGLTDPFVTWSTAVCSPSGLAVARGRAWVGALRGECLWSVRLDGPRSGRKVRHFHQRFGRIRTVAHAPDGSLWLTTSNRDGRGDPAVHDDRVIRVTLS